MPMFRSVILLLALLLGAGAVAPTVVHATVNEVVARKEYTGNGATTAFTYNFKIYLKTDIEVSVDSVVKTVDTHYTVSGLGEAAGGTVTFLTAPANGTRVTLLRKQPLKQSSDYQPNEDFPSERIEKDLDKLAMADQMLAERLSRTITLPRASTLDNVTIGDPGASQFIRWNAAGTALEAADLPTLTGAAVSALASYTKATLPSGASVGTLARVTDDVRGVWIKLSHGWVSLDGRRIDITWFGAVGDGVSGDPTLGTDNAAAIQAAIDVQAITGGRLYIPEGVFRFASMLTWVGRASNVNPDRIIEGAGWGSILQSGVASGVAIYVNENSATPNVRAHMTFQDFQIIGGAGESHLLRIDYPFLTKLHRMRIRDSTGVGLYLGRAQAADIAYSNIADHAGVCIQIGTDAAGSAAGQATVIDRNVIKGCPTGIQLGSGGGGGEYVVTNNVIETHDTIGVDVRTFGARILHNSFEGTPTHLNIGDATATVDGIYVAYNNFSLTSGAITIADHDGVDFVHNNMFGSGNSVTLGTPKSNKISRFAHNQITPGNVSITASNPSKWVVEDLRQPAASSLTALFTDADTTPSVKGLTTFQTANTGATSITAFDDCYSGKLFTVHVNDANTTFVHGAALVLQGAANIAAELDDRFLFLCTTANAAGGTAIARHVGMVDGSLFRAVHKRQLLTIADSGGAGAATATLTPTRSYIEIDCQDADGCDVTLGETGIATGTIVYILARSTNAINFADTAGVSHLAGGFGTTSYDVLTLIYAADNRWVEVSRSVN